VCVLESPTTTYVSLYPTRRSARCTHRGAQHINDSTKRVRGRRIPVRSQKRQNVQRRCGFLTLDPELRATRPSGESHLCTTCQWVLEEGFMCRECPILWQVLRVSSQPQNTPCGCLTDLEQNQGWNALPCGCTAANTFSSVYSTRREVRRHAAPTKRSTWQALPLPQS
jgi:hypothetical protein